jgi:hypothetical protein
MNCRLAIVLFQLGCAAHGGVPKPAGPANTPSEAKAASSNNEGEPCAPARAIVDERFNPVDMNSEASITSVVGHRVFVCAPVVRASSGVVVDESTRAPVGGAVVTIEAWHAMAPIAGPAPNRHLLKVVDVRTDSHGRWQAPESSIWLPGILAADGLPYVIRSYCVHADGHAPFVLDPWKTDKGDDSTAEIALRASAGPDPKPGGEVSSCGIPLGPPL